MIYFPVTMLIYTKDKSVYISVINDQFLTCQRIVFRIFQKYNLIPIITSANDGVHVSNSLHYLGLAWDFRIWNIDDPSTQNVDEMELCKQEIEHDLQAIDFRYEILYKNFNPQTGKVEHTDHMHIEYDLNKKYKYKEETA